MLASGVRDQQAGHPVKQDQRIVGGVKLELPQRGEQRRGASIRAQATQGLGFGGKPIAGQCSQPTDRNINCEVADADRADGRQALERFGGLAGGQLARPAAEQFQARELLLVSDLEQLPETVALGDGGLDERAVQPLGGAVTG